MNKFSILISSEEHGAVIKEAKPPTTTGHMAATISLRKKLWSFWRKILLAVLNYKNKFFFHKFKISFFFWEWEINMEGLDNNNQTE